MIVSRPGGASDIADVIDISRGRRVDGAGTAPTPAPATSAVDLAVAALKTRNVPLLMELLPIVAQSFADARQPCARVVSDGDEVRAGRAPPLPAGPVARWGGVVTDDLDSASDGESGGIGPAGTAGPPSAIEDAEGCRRFDAEHELMGPAAYLDPEARYRWRTWQS